MHPDSYTDVKPSKMSKPDLDLYIAKHVFGWKESSTGGLGKPVVKCYRRDKFPGIRKEDEMFLYHVPEYSSDQSVAIDMLLRVSDFGIETSVVSARGKVIVTARFGKRDMSPEAYTCKSFAEAAARAIGELCHGSKTPWPLIFNG